MAAKKVAKTTAASKGKKTVKRAEKVAPAKMVAKNVSLLISIGTEDRDRTMDEFITALKDALKKVKASNITVASHYYVVDGKVFRTDDFDVKTQNVRPGAVPPPWAGGPAVREVQKEKEEHKPRTPAEALRDLRENTDWGKRAEKRVSRWDDEDEALEEFDWDSEDVHDTEELESVAEESTKRAIKRLKSAETPKKRVVKKTAPQSASKTKRVVKRGNK